MPATAKGIYHNLKESKYAVSNSEIAFYFSSKFYLNKFLDGYQENRKVYKRKMNNLLSYSPYNLNTIADICFYQAIEKRGFHVKLNRLDMTKNDLYQYALRKMSQKETLEWVEINGKEYAKIYNKV